MTIAAPVASWAVLSTLEDLGLDGDVEGRGRLVGDDDVGVVGDGHGDHRPAGACRRRTRAGTPWPARRRWGCRPASSSSTRLLCGLGLADVAVDPDGLGDLVADRVDGREGRQRVLEDHRDARRPAARRAPGRAGRAAPRPGTGREPRDAGRRREQAHDGQRRHRLAGARLADDAEHLARGEGVAQAPDGLRPCRSRSGTRRGGRGPRARPRACGRGVGRSASRREARRSLDSACGPSRPLEFGSRASRRPSPMTFTASTAVISRHGRRRGTARGR